MDSILHSIPHHDRPGAAAGFLSRTASGCGGRGADRAAVWGPPPQLPLLPTTKQPPDPKSPPCALSRPVHTAQEAATRSGIKGARRESSAPEAEREKFLLIRPGVPEKRGPLPGAAVSGRRLGRR